MVLRLIGSSVYERRNASPSSPQPATGTSNLNCGISLLIFCSSVFQLYEFSQKSLSFPNFCCGRSSPLIPVFSLAHLEIAQFLQLLTGLLKQIIRHIELKRSWCPNCHCVFDREERGPVVCKHIGSKPEYLNIYLNI